MTGTSPNAAAHVFLVAGEESGDRLGAALIAALRKRDRTLRFSSVGGAHMAAQGVSSLFPLGDLALVGVVAIFGSLRTILARIETTAAAIIAAKPDVVVIIDSPDFTHRVARKVRARAPQIPIVDYVCPSVWAWRPGRARAMRAYVDHVLALLPFEPEAMRRYGGPPTSFVGHPLSEQVASLWPNADEARRRLAEPPLVLAMPGSRAVEIRRLAAIFGGALARVADRYGPLELVVPTVPRLGDAVAKAVTSWRVPAKIVTDPAEKLAAFRKARVALAKSGTSTLELALAGVPTVAAYKIPFVEELVARLVIKVPSVILANLVLGENAVPEFLQRDCTPERLAAALLPLLTDTPERARQLAAFERLDQVMGIGEAAPSERAAAVVLSYISGRNHGATTRW